MTLLSLLNRVGAARSTSHASSTIGIYTNGRYNVNIKCRPSLFRDSQLNVKLTDPSRKYCVTASQPLSTMGSVDNPSLAGIQLPTIRLDTTLTELYRRAGPKNANARLGMVFCGVNSGVDLNPDFPRNTKYLYQDSPFNTVPREELTRKNHELKKSLAMKYLSLIPQRDAFIAGPSSVIMFNMNQSPSTVEHDREEASTTLSVLDPSQRPSLVFCPGPSKIPMKEHGIDRITYKIVVDGLEAYPLTHCLETHWVLNSKAGLARSGLPTPKCDIVSVKGYPPVSPKSCCEACRADTRLHDLTFIPVSCTGPRGQWLEAQSSRILSAISSRPVPFVLKNQQVFGGAGTWVVTTQEQKDELLSDFESADGPLRKLLSQVTAENHHMDPGAVIISDMVSNPIGDYGLTFFVKENGEHIFLAASEQMIDGNSAWVGSTIVYSRQEALHQRFKELVERTAGFVSKHGYVGPVGIDVLETKEEGETETHTGERTKYHVVDLNVRTSGSLALPLLKGHFCGKGLDYASSFGITVKGTREEFVRQWKRDFEEGRMFALSWYEDEEGSIADLAVGAKDETELGEMIEKVREGSEEVVF
ncbi:hypothetical protein QBC40DRAFT_282849 [Triangularia verruculosa]|uniref:ATP-grasp domain-containing protein n=1 Tax=Triangularia verruculosa TaxID=2587418 RepID=A0AAN7ATN0_9PEZI|nr:hypothetical protein QBC40DRAFT_282849 [Triangularia verruculosa]